MREEQWFQNLCFVDSSDVSEKKIKKKTSEVIKQLKKVYKSSNNISIFNAKSDNFKECHDIFVMTLFLVVDTQKTKESKEQVIKERVENGFFSNNSINKAYASIPVIFKENIDGKSNSFLDIMQDKQAMLNYCPWSIKIKDAKVKLEDFPALPEICNPPPVGVTTRSYGYCISNHASSAKLANDLSYIFNVKIAIDDFEYPVQAILTKKIYNEVFDTLINENNIFNNIYTSLTQRENACVFSDIKRTHISGDICLLIDELEQEEIEITPVMSIQFYENCKQVNSKLINNGCYAGGFKKKSSVVVGGGQPQNIGIFALNTSGVISHDTQSDIPYIGNKNLKGRIKEMSHKNLLSYQRRYIQKIKNINESDHNYEQRKRKGISKAIKLYVRRIEEMRDDINKLFKSQLQDDITSEEGCFTSIRNDFIERMSQNDKTTYDFICSVLLNQKENELAINFLAKHIYMEIYIGTPGKNLSQEEYTKDIEFITKNLWNIYIPYNIPKYAN